jgi:hypothetical protein
MPTRLRRPTPFGLLATLALAGAAALGGCSVFETPRAPRPCGAVFSEVRCAAVRDAVALQLGAQREDVTSIEILPDPTNEVVNGRTVIHLGGPRLRLRVSVVDGSSHDLAMCVGVAMEPACQAEPELQVSSPISSGYFDIPEGSTAVPGPDADALAVAKPLRIDRLDIAVDRVGVHEIRLGEALLPNGLLTTAEFELVDTWPEGLSIVDGGVRLEVRSLETGAVLWNSYEHGWRDGTERVEAVLVFDVFHVDPEAVLSIRDVVVE